MSLEEFVIMTYRLENLFSFEQPPRPFIGFQNNLVRTESSFYRSFPVECPYSPIFWIRFECLTHLILLGLIRIPFHLGYFT